MNAVENLSSDEKRAYDLITSQDGIVQSELWKSLGLDSRKGSRIAKSLAEAGLIEREETTSDGRKTYLLKPIEKEDQSSEWVGEKTPEASEDAEDGEGEDELTSREERALSLIQDQRGMYQSEFWKELDVSSRTGSRLASDLEEQGLIRREETTHNGRKTYLLRPAKKDLDFSLLMAGDEISPLVGEGDVDPIESEEFSQWVLRLIREQQN